MALRHREKNFWASSSILNRFSHEVFSNFKHAANGVSLIVPDLDVGLAEISQGRAPHDPGCTKKNSQKEHESSTKSETGMGLLHWKGARASKWRMHRQIVPFRGDLMSAYEKIFYEPTKFCVFLDSSSKALLRPDVRFSILGGGRQAGPFCELLTYEAGAFRRMVAESGLARTLLAKGTL